MIKKILKDELLIGNLISNFAYSFSYPFVYYSLMNSINENLISINSIAICLGGIVIPYIWNKYSDKIYSYYGYILFSEIIFYSILVLLILFKIINNKIYYILDTFLFVFITKNIICGNNKLISIKYKNKEREEYDNNLTIVSNSSSLIGFILSLFFHIDINIAFIFIWIGIVSDNIFYYISYKKSKKELNKGELTCI